ncbi:cytochrome P450 71A9-like [Iris pallida]|uniref:Cytochrome P450 71A9-like n=1 Tax=Iris pallida TaxID=29817 RepID=A0AAX6DPF2_IRIPA|nr:cytochrome P450 71A9-like [Iris pallida]KAJ6820740.1 cytochrome P450 71A9-like [Iris pallida]
MLTAIGKRYHAAGEGSRVKRILAETQALFMGFFFEDYFPSLGWLDRVTGMRARLERNFSELDGFYQEVIDEHRDPAWRWEEDRAEDAIDALLNIQKRGGANVTDQHIKGVLMNIFVAGSDTSSASVEWTMAELMRHPSVMRKAQNEVRSIVGKKGKVEESDLDRLQYLKCVLKEVFRVHPTVPLLVQRETIQHCRVDGYDIPAKTRLLVNTLAIGRDASIWERPEEFDPERFVGTDIDIRGHDFELIPFGAGRRICPGMGVGILVVELALANLLYSFDWELPEGTTKEDIDMSEAPGITVHRKSHLHLVAKRV